jgi:hypothetical protein
MISNIKTPPVGEILLVKQELETTACPIVMKKNRTAIFLSSEFVLKIGPYYINCSLQDTSLYKWKFIYNGEMVPVNWYVTLPTPYGTIENKWENFWSVLPKEEYKNYALQKI